MSVPQIEKLNLAIDQASASFNRLLLLAGPAESGKTTLLRRISDRCDDKMTFLLFGVEAWH